MSPNPRRCSLCHGQPPLFAELTSCPRCAMRAGDARPAPAPSAAPAARPATQPSELASRVYLVACGARKAATAAPARELYQGSLFVAARRVAELAGVPWFVLSARHHLVEPAAELAPYDERLPQAAAELALWGRVTVNDLLRRFPAWHRLELVGLAGAAYLDALAPHLPPAWTLARPLDGLGLGHRLSWLAAERRRLGGTP